MFIDPLQSASQYASNELYSVKYNGMEFNINGR